MGPPDDERLLRAITVGDEDAFSAFYRRHLPAVLAYFARRVRHGELAFDLAAETFATVVLAAPGWRGEGSAVAWLFGIARNKLLESLRSGRVEDAARRRLQLTPVELDDGGLVLVEERIAAGNPALDAALAELPHAIREAVIARVVAEDGYEEIAERLGCSEQVVRQRVSRGLRSLRTSLGEQR